MLPYDFHGYGKPQQPINKNNKKLKENQEYETPDYFYMLTETEQAEYRDLQILLSSPSNRYSRNKKLETIKESIDKVKQYIFKNDRENNWKRSLVCGLIILNRNKKETEECIAINIRQLRILIGKSKSTINGSLAQMGFTTFQTKGDDQSLLLTAMPYFEGKYFEMRQWTIRKRKCDNIDIIIDNDDDQLPPLEINNMENEEIKVDNFDFLDNDYILTDLKVDNDQQNTDIFNFNFDYHYDVFTAITTQTSNNNGAENNMFADVESTIKMNKMQTKDSCFIDNIKDINIESIINQNILSLLLISPLLQIYLFNSLLVGQLFNVNIITFI